MTEIIGPLAGGVHVPERRTVVAALAGEDAVVVEFGGLVFEMPFADHGGLVAGFFHQAGQGVVGDGQIVAEGFDSVGVGVLASHQGGATGRADGIGANCVGKHHAFGGETVEGRGGIEGR